LVSEERCRNPEGLLQLLFDICIKLQYAPFSLDISVLWELLAQQSIGFVGYHQPNTFRRLLKGVERVLGELLFRNWRQLACDVDISKRDSYDDGGSRGRRRERKRRNPASGRQ
jgi:hypothetical protein